MSDKWERRDKKRKDKNKMPMHGKSIKRLENDREMREKYENRPVEVGTRFYCENTLMTATRIDKDAKWWAEGTLNQNKMLAKFAETYIQKRRI